MNAAVPTIAHAVLIASPQPGEDKPRRATLIVAESDREKAKAIVKAALKPGECVTAAYPLPLGCLEAFDLRPGEFTAWLGGGLGR